MVAAKDRNRHLGVGLYSMAEAARLLHVHPTTLNRWTDRDDGLVAPKFAASEHTISFLELMELHFIKMFRESGVTLPVIRKASQIAAERFSTEYPFSVKRFDTDGKSVFATIRSETVDEEFVEELHHGQRVFDKIVRPFFKKLDYDTSAAEVARYWPLDKSGGVVLDPQLKFGKPVVASIGIPTKALYDAFKAQKTPNKSAIASWFGVPTAAVSAAIAFENSVAV
jgi:DNA-binding transcriptional MerR regulator/uncharacterized protein (DUF433 family)